MSDPAAPGRTPGARAPVALPQAIRQWREQSVAWVRAADTDTSADTAAVLARRRAPAGTPRVVVVGETNRGKSSLVNALLGLPGLSPVDAGLATGTYLQFTQGSSPTAVAHFGGGMADITFPTRDLPTWATMNSEPDHDLPPPRWIEVVVPSPLLDAVVLIDTPGVGGLVAGHADLAAEAAASATALLFVVDASAPLTRGEVQFLQAVGDRVDSVHFVVTKTDMSRGWREIVQADQQLLARHVPRFTDAPFHPVSSTLALAADAQQDPRIGEVIREQSGILALRTILADDVSARASLLADANVIRNAVTVLAGELVGLSKQRRALTSGAEQSEALKIRKDELLGRRKSGGRSWQVMLRAEVQRARVELSHETAREVREASTMFRGAIDGADAEQLKQLPFHIDAYAQAMTARAHGRLLDVMGRIVHTVLAELFTAEELAQLASSLATRPYAPLVTRGPDRTKSADDTIMSFAGGGIGLTLGSLVRMGAGAVLPAAFGVVLLPVSLALGGAAAFFMVRSRRRMQDKQFLKSWLMEVLSEAKAQIDQNIAEQFIEADEQLTLALDDVLSKQVAALEAEIRQVDGALKLDATERASRMRSTAERHAGGTALVTTGEALLERIRSTRPAGALTLPRGPTGSTVPGGPAGPAIPARSIALPPGLPGAPPPDTTRATEPSPADVTAPQSLTPPVPAGPPPGPAGPPAGPAAPPAPFEHRSPMPPVERIAPMPPGGRRAPIIPTGHALGALFGHPAGSPGPVPRVPPTQPPLSGPATGSTPTPASGATPVDPDATGVNPLDTSVAGENFPDPDTTDRTTIDDPGTGRPPGPSDPAATFGHAQQ